MDQLDPSLCIYEGCQYYGNVHLGCGAYCSRHYRTVNNMSEIIYKKETCCRYHNVIDPPCDFVASGRGFNACCLYRIYRCRLRTQENTHLGMYPCNPCWAVWSKTKESRYQLILARCLVNIFMPHSVLNSNVLPDEILRYIISFI